MFLDANEMEIEPIFRICEYLELRLENGKTNIYVKDNEDDWYLFNHCKFLMLNIPTEEIGYEESQIINIDEASRRYSKDMEQNRSEYDISAECEFQAHCSNLQAWYENDFNPNIIHSSLGVPLLEFLVLRDRRIFDALLYHLDDNWTQYKTYRRRKFVMDKYENIIDSAIKHYDIPLKEMEQTSIFYKTMRLLYMSKKLHWELDKKRLINREKRKKRAYARFRYHEIKCYGKDLEFRKQLRAIRNYNHEDYLDYHNEYQPLKDIVNSEPTDYLPYLYAKGYFTEVGVVSYITIPSNDKDIVDTTIIRDENGNYFELDNSYDYNLDIRIDGYYNYSAVGCEWKAMEVRLGRYRLYFSYHTLIGFQVDDNIFITDEKYSYTTSQHKYSIGNWNNRIYVPDNVFEYIVKENLKSIL